MLFRTLLHRSLFMFFGSHILIGQLIILFSTPTEAQRWWDRFLYVYSLVMPYSLPNFKKLTDLEDIHNCECPRVYWPACGKDNVTYVNACVMNCMKKEIRRLGPCVTYRRQNQLIPFYMPLSWIKNSSVFYKGLKM